MGTFHFFGVRLREAARWSWQRPSWQLANAHVREEPPKSTCALIASRGAAHHARDRKGFNRKPAPQPSHSESRTICQRTKKCPVVYEARRRSFVRQRVAQSLLFQPNSETRVTSMVGSGVR